MFLFQREGRYDSSMSNVNVQQFPTSLIEAIRNQEHASRVLYLSKGSSEYLYVVTYEQDGKEIFNVVTYGKTRIRDYLRDFYAKPTEKLTYAEKNEFDKLVLFIETLFSEYALDSVEIDGNKMSLGENIDDFLKSIS